MYSPTLENKKAWPRALATTGPILFVALTLASMAAEVGEQGRDKTDFERVLRDAISLAKGASKDLDRFKQLTMPWAPLDLLILKHNDVATAEAQRNVFLGVAGSAAGLSEDQILGLPKEFFARYDDDAGIQPLVDTAGRLRALADDFAALQGIRVMATWSYNEYRINDVLFFDGRVHEYECSHRDEFFPCGHVQVFGGAEHDPTTRALATPRAAKKSGPDRYSAALVDEMRELGVVALVRESWGVRAVVDGVADNEIGFMVRDAAPAIGDYLGSGKVVAMVRGLGRGMYLYGTN